MKWIGPFKIDELLDNCLNDSFVWPPESNGVYLISRKEWSKKPTKDCVPLYVGSNTGKSKRFLTRVGDLIADLFGFSGGKTGHHSGGQSLYDYCKENNLSPKTLYISWLKNCKCVRCDENEIYDNLQPLLNKRRPNRCNKH